MLAHAADNTPTPTRSVITVDGEYKWPIQPQLVVNAQSLLTWSSPSWSQFFHFAEKRLSHRMLLAVAVVQVRERPYI